MNSYTPPKLKIKTQYTHRERHKERADREKERKGRMRERQN